MGQKCTKCNMPENSVYYTEIHVNRRHCRFHNYKDNLLCNHCDNFMSEHGCYHKFKYKILCCWI